MSANAHWSDGCPSVQKGPVYDLSNSYQTKILRCVPACFNLKVARKRYCIMCTGIEAALRGDWGTRSLAKVQHFSNVHFG